MAVKPKLESTNFQLKAIKHQGYLMIYQWFIFLINECGIWAMPQRASDLHLTAGSDDSTTAYISPMTVNEEVETRPAMFRCCFGTWGVLKRIGIMYGALKYALLLFFIHFAMIWQDFANYQAL